MSTGFWRENLRERCDFENLGVNTNIVLKQIYFFKEIFWKDVNWVHPTQLRV
jgi:hypothetical protein